MASARLPASLQSGEDYRWKDLSKHRVYTVAAGADGETFLTSAASDTGYGIACRCTAGNGVFTSVTSGLTGTITLGVSGATTFTGKLHLFDGRRLSATQTTGGGGTGYARIANPMDESANTYHKWHWLTYDFPALSAALPNSGCIVTGDTWASTLSTSTSGKTYPVDWAWEETAGSTAYMGTIAYTPTTGIFTFTVTAGEPTGRLHVWTS